MQAAPGAITVEADDEWLELPPIKARDEFDQLLLRSPGDQTVGAVENALQEQISS